jgi:hypothetical protein
MKTFILMASMLMALTANAQFIKERTMEVAVWDTYVPRKDGRVMHFDIIAPSAMKDTTVIHGYGKAYLKTKGEGGQPLTSKECRFCHVRSLQPKWEADIQRQGYFILEMENCD